MSEVTFATPTNASTNATAVAPARERGLKCGYRSSPEWNETVAPVRECGLKY